MKTKQEIESYNFHIEERTEDTHSLTSEEFANEFEKKSQAAIEGGKKIREQMIKQSLRIKGINPYLVNIKDIIDRKYR